MTVQIFPVDQPIDMLHNAINGRQLEVLSSAPSSPSAGWEYYDSTLHAYGFYNGSTWVYPSMSPSATASVLGLVQLAGDLAGSGSVATAPIISTGAITIAKLNTGVTLATLSAANASTSAITASSQRLISVADPTSAQDAVTLNFAGATYATIGSYNARAVKDPVDAVATTNGTLASAYANGSVVDGVTLATGMRILLTGQTTTSEDGIYVVQASGAPVRSADAATSTQLTVGDKVAVKTGTDNQGTTWTYVSGAFTAQVWATTIWLGGAGSGNHNLVGANALTTTLAASASGGLINLIADTNTVKVNASGLGPNGRTPAAALDLASSTATAGGIAFGANEYQVYRDATNSLTINATTTKVSALNAGNTAITGTESVSGTLSANGGITVASSQTISMGSNVVTNVATPVAGTDGVNKTYVDNALAAITEKNTVRAVTTGAETYTILSGTVTVIAGTTVDGTSPAVGDMVLVKNAPAASGAGSGGAQTSSSQPANGIYTVTNATVNLTVSRSTDAATWNELVGAVVASQSGGTANPNTIWQSLTNLGGTLGTTAIAFTLSGNASAIVGDGTYITRSGNTIQPVATPADPTPGSNGTVVATAAALTRTMRFAIKGDGSTTAYTLTHNFSNRLVHVSTQLDSSTTPQNPTIKSWQPSSANAVVVTPSATLGAGVILWVLVQG